MAKERSTGFDLKLLAIGITLFLQAGAGLWYIASVDSRVNHNNYQIKMLEKDVTHNSKFVLEWPAGRWLSGELWPAGKWGSGELPSDTRQDLKIAALEKHVEKIMTKLYNGGVHP